MASERSASATAASRCVCRQSDPGMQCNAKRQEGKGRRGRRGKRGGVRGGRGWKNRQPPQGRGGCGVFCLWGKFVTCPTTEAHLSSFSFFSLSLSFLPKSLKPGNSIFSSNLSPPSL